MRRVRYFETTIEGKRGGQMARMKAVRFFNPLVVPASGEVTEADIDGLSLFRFSKHANAAVLVLVSSASGPRVSGCTRKFGYFGPLPVKVMNNY